MKLVEDMYKKKTGKDAPADYDSSFFSIFTKPIRKYYAQVVAPNCPFNGLRIFIYRLCGFKIGKNVFIGMRCYLDDTCYKLLTIGDNVTISYGVYFACHGKGQGHRPITIENNAYIGMRASIISKGVNADGIVIGQGARVGAASLVNKTVPAGATVVGVPARVIKEGTTADA